MINHKHHVAPKGTRLPFKFGKCLPPGWKKIKTIFNEKISIPFEGEYILPPFILAEKK